MFSSREQLERKTGPYGIGRQSYLQSLVTEFQDTDSEDAREQVLGNLANFAYDPINYEYMRQLNVIDLFLDSMDDSNEKLVNFATGGLCNLCLDRQNKAYILKNDGVNLMKNALSSTNDETVLSAMTCLMFLVTPQSKSEITCLPIIDAMLRFSNSTNPRLSNLASVFLQDYCTEEQIRNARESQQEWQRQVAAQARDSLQQMASSSSHHLPHS